MSCWVLTIVYFDGFLCSAGDVEGLLLPSDFDGFRLDPGDIPDVLPSFLMFFYLLAYPRFYQSSLEPHEHSKNPR